MPIAFSTAADARPVHCISGATWDAVRAGLSAAAREFAEAAGFEPKAGRFLLVPGAGGMEALFGVDGGADADPLAVGRLARLLPAGDWRIAAHPGDLRLAALGFLLGAYRFDRYRAPAPAERACRLVAPEGVDAEELVRIAEAVYRGRDLINTPANDLGPAELAGAVRALAARHGARVTVIEGEALRAGFPLVEAVGQGSERPPCVIDLVAGEESHPKVTLVGKGVVFDTGGLDLKPSASMLLMKKDMGGAAVTITAADLILSAKLPVRLRLIVGAVENAVSGRAFRPSDVYKSRKGLTVEIGNTDAEGRLVLADCLALADEEAPDLMIDAATLTGAARVALGPDLPPLFTSDDALAADLAEAGRREADPVWRLPLWAPYRANLDSKVADTNSTGGSGFGGSVVAALFLARFVEKAKAYAHLDVYGWVPADRPAAITGGEVNAARAIYRLVQDRYGPGA